MPSSGMTYFHPPKFSVDQKERSVECAAMCKRALTAFIRDAVEAGWREQEAALFFADASEDYVAYLAATPNRKWVAANSN